MSKNKNNNTFRSFTEMMNQVDDNVKSRTPTQPAVQYTAPTEPLSLEQTPDPTPMPEALKILENHTVQKDPTGQTVAKPEVDPTKAVIQLKKPLEKAAECTTADTDVSRIQHLIKSYLDYNTGVIMRSEREQLLAGQKFREILFFAVEHPHTPVLDEVYKFFYKNKDRILAPQLALPAVLNMSKSTVEKINCVYTLFRGLTDPKPFQFNASNVRLLLRGMDPTNIEEMLIYFENKAKNR